MIRNSSTLDKWNEENAVWSEDIFEMNNIQFKEEEVELAKERILRLYYEFNGEFPERKRIRHPK